MNAMYGHLLQSAGTAHERPWAERDMTPSRSRARPWRLKHSQHKRAGKLGGWSAGALLSHCLETRNQEFHLANVGGNGGIKGTNSLVNNGSLNMANGILIACQPAWVLTRS